MSQRTIIASSTSSGVVDFLEGNTGGPVGPNGANTINIVGSGSINVSGNAGTNTLTITSSGTSKWLLISTSQVLVSDTGYICTGGGALSLALPAVSSLGDVIEITLDGSTSWTLTQAAGQQVRFGDLQTTLGAGGSIMTTEEGDTIRMVCQIANTKWNILSSVGNLIVV